MEISNEQSHWIEEETELQKKEKETNLAPLIIVIIIYLLVILGALAY